MDFNTVSTSFHYAIRNYAYDRVPSCAGIEARMAEHFHSVPTYAYGVLRDATYRAADALREYVDASKRMTDYAWENGETDELNALWREANDREENVHALIAYAMGYEYDREAGDIITD